MMTEAQLRAAFLRINGSAKLEGTEPDAELLALQERIIRGEITTEQALHELVEDFSHRDASVA